MITINNYECKTSIEEFTLNEFDCMNLVLNDHTLNKMEKNLQLMKIAGYKGELKLVSLKTLKTYISELNAQAEKDAEFVVQDLLKSIEINGRNYVCYTENINDELMGWDTGLIAELPRKRGGEYMSEAIAILFKDDQLTHVEHYTDAHIKYKTELFGNQKLSLFYPYIKFIVQNIINHAEAENNNDRLDQIINEVEQLSKAQDGNN